MGFMFYAQGMQMPFLAVIAGSVGLYLCTVCVQMAPVIVAAVAAVGGMGYFAWLMISG
jgi:hypothetical protein